MEVPTRAKNLGTGGEKAEQALLRFAWLVVAAALAGRAAELPRPADARVDEVLGDGRHPEHRHRGELGVHARPVQVGVRLPQPLGGYVADRFSRRLTICGSLFVWSAVTWWTGHVTTYHELLAARSLMGISEAFYIPAALALIADYHTGRTRSRAVGLHQMAIYCGVILGGFGGYVADAPASAGGSRSTPAASFGMLYAVPLAAPLRDAPRPADAAAASRRTSAAPALAELLTNLVVHPAGAVLHAAGDGRLGGARLDAGDPQAAVRHRPGQGRRGGDALLAGRRRSSARWAAAGWPTAGCGGRARGRIYVSAIGMGLIVPAIFGVGDAGVAGHGGRRSWSCSASAGGSSTATTCRSSAQIVRPAPAGHRLRAS